MLRKVSNLNWKKFSSEVCKKSVFPEPGLHRIHTRVKGCFSTWIENIANATQMIERVQLEFSWSAKSLKGHSLRLRLLPPTLKQSSMSNS